MKRGQIWISVVLYMALGVVALTLILTAGVPLVQKMKDKNTFAQTKSLFFTLDNNIKAVTNEGPGATRLLTPFEIKKGDFYVMEDTNTIWWKMKTTAKLLEPSYDARGDSTDVPEFKEGPLTFYTNETIEVDEFMLYFKLDYSNTADIFLISDFTNPFSGIYSVKISTNGSYVSNKPVVNIEIKG